MSETASTYNCSTLYPEAVSSDKEAKSKTEIVKIRLSKKQKQKIENYAESRGCSVAQVLRNYIDRLANK